MHSKLRLLRLVWPFAAIILVQWAVIAFSMEILCSARAYVAGESLWSKGQKTAIHSLDMYVGGGNEADFQRYLAAVDVPLGDRAARMALEQTQPDLGAARAGFLRGGNHPDDLAGLIWLFRHFRALPFFSTAIEKWKATDGMLDELTALGETIRAEKTSGKMTPDVMARREAQISSLNLQFAPLAHAFSEAISEGARQAKLILIFSNLIAVFVLLILLIWYARGYLAENRAYEDALRAEKERAEIILASIGDAVISIDPQGRIDYLNPTAEQIIGAEGKSARGCPAPDVLRLVDPVSGESSRSVLMAAINAPPVPLADARQLLVRGDASTIPVSLAGAPLTATGEQAAGTVIVLRDMTNEMDYITRLAWQATHDPLTNLPNRRQFEVCLADALVESIDTGEHHAVAMLDLDQFKVVNDTCGHVAGDELLRHMAERLRQSLHRDEMVARLGGDEFAILLRRCPIDRAALICERIRETVEDLNFVWQGSSFNTTASVGLVQVTGASVSAEDVIRAADVACYLAKDRGRNRIQIHDPDDAELRSRFGEMVWVQRIHEALEESRFCLYAQPILDLKGQDDAGLHAEVLVRMRDRDGRLVPPGEFIPAAERYGLMPLLDRWIIQNSFAALANADRIVAMCAINLSGASFNDEDFVDFIRDQLRVTGVSPSSICFEITETAAITNLATADRFIRALKTLGFSFALDDFGAGMSSFTYLKNLPVDFIKIDGSFVKQMLSDHTDRAIVDLIARLGVVMGKRTIAEFVENDAMIEMLRQIGVDYAQGYGISKPQPLEDVFGCINTGRAVA